MPKRKSNPCASLDRQPPSLSSLDAAFDLLACDTFGRLDTLVQQFEKAVALQLDKSVVRARWDEAVKRYYVMKEMDGLCCTQSVNSSRRNSVERGDKELFVRERRDHSMFTRLPRAGQRLHCQVWKTVGHYRPLHILARQQSLALVRKRSKSGAVGIPRQATLSSRTWPTGPSGQLK